MFVNLAFDQRLYFSILSKVRNLRIVAAYI